MQLIGKPLPRNKLSATVFFGFQMVRVCMQRLWIGYYLERWLMRLLKREVRFKTCELHLFCYRRSFF
jgi:hypothetical protein